MQCRRVESLGLTLVELVAIVGIVVASVAVVLPALAKNRERARRAQCARNLNQIALACSEYESNHRCFPMGQNRQAYVAPLGDALLGYHTGWSLHAALLPHLGQAAAFNAINFDLGPYQLRNSTAAGSMYARLWCPSDPEVVGLRCLIGEQTAWDGTTLGVTYTSYAGFVGSFGFERGAANRLDQLAAQDGVFRDVGLPTALGGPGSRSPVQVSDVSDGLSATLSLGERAHGRLSKFNCGPGGQCSFRGNGWWASSDHGDAGITAFYPPNFTPFDLHGTHSLGDTGSPTARCDDATPYVMSASSYHPGGANFAFADGSVRFLRDTIQSWPYRRAAGALDPSCVPSGAIPRGVYQSIVTRAGGEGFTGPGF